MKYSKELHEHARTRIHDQGEVISFGTPFVECLLDEIERLQAEVDRLTPRNAGEILAGFKMLILDCIPADTILIPRIAGERVELIKVKPPDAS